MLKAPGMAELVGRQIAAIPAYPRFDGVRFRGVYDLVFTGGNCFKLYRFDPTHAGVKAAAEAAIVAPG